MAPPVAKQVWSVHRPGHILICFYDSYDYAWVSHSKIEPLRTNFYKHSATDDPSLKRAIAAAVERSEKALGPITNASRCFVCAKGGNVQPLFVCENCRSAYHTDCVPGDWKPSADLPKWYCPRCLEKHLDDEISSSQRVDYWAPGVAGLVNIGGNACYINSIVQTLNVMTLFREQVVALTEHSSGSVPASLY